MAGRVPAAKLENPVKRYCITDSIDVAARAARDGVDMIQIRAKELSARDQCLLVRSVLGRSPISQSKLLVNTRTDIALACHGDGVHLPAHSIPPTLIRVITPPRFLIGVSCHTIEELRTAEQEGADFAVFGPIFPTSSKSGPPLGIDALRQAVLSVHHLPIYALGGVTAGNARLCMEAGATGIAGISLFL